MTHKYLACAIITRIIDDYSRVQDCRILETRKMVCFTLEAVHLLLLYVEIPLTPPYHLKRGTKILQHLKIMEVALLLHYAA